MSTSGFDGSSDSSIVPGAGASTGASSSSAPWAVDALGPSDVGPPPLPSRADAILTIRVGEPLGRARGGWKSDVNFEVSEGYAVFKQKCIAKYTALYKKPLVLPDDSSVYLRRARNDTQAKYIELTSDNFLTALQYRWKLLTTDDLRHIGDFRSEAFLYVKRAAQPEQFHRATARRIANARVQRIAFKTANAVQFEAITSHHLDVVHARRPESAPFEVPEDNTTAQAMELGRQQEALQQQEADEQAIPDTATVSVRFNGLWMPLEVDILSLRRALRLPGHDIFSRGIYHEFTPTQPTNGMMNDQDHADDEPMN
ncbi:hypothetical protein GN244_ATG14320 [Phytophthora infestans]|uniref:Uncharacterized protein n=1 Tax=Phytophthora infestans TaxID=4787 RepID=A0A833SWI0_PHYIN|nr:hypothetical protein GN244_ATG14320 [Phytophthora infestans]